MLRRNKMKKYKLLILLSILTTISVILYIYFNGYCAIYHRNTGPDFEIVKNSFLRKTHIVANNKSFSEFYSLNSLDTQRGFPGPNNKYLILGQVTSIKKSGDFSEYPVIKISMRFDITWYYFLYYLLIIEFLLLIFLR